MPDLTPAQTADALAAYLARHPHTGWDDLVAASIWPGALRIHARDPGHARALATADLPDADYDPRAHDADDGDRQLHHNWSGTWTTPTGFRVRMEITAIEHLPTDTDEEGT